MFTITKNCTTAKQAAELLLELLDRHKNKELVMSSIHQAPNNTLLIVHFKSR